MVFFFNDTATTEIYTLSLHDALPIFAPAKPPVARDRRSARPRSAEHERAVRLAEDRKSTRLNSSHSQISYAVFCLKKKKDNAWAEPVYDTLAHARSGLLAGRWPPDTA